MPTFIHKGQPFTFNNIYYIEKTGSDSNDGLSTSSAFLTYDKAKTVMQSLDAIVFGEGDFDVTTTGGSYGIGGLTDDNKKITIFGKDFKTNLYNDPNKVGGAIRDMHIICTRNNSTRVYNCVLTHNPGTRAGTKNYSSALIGYDSVFTGGYFYNCVIKDVSNSTPNFIYNNSATGRIYFYNCTFVTTSPITASYSGANLIYSLGNCAFSSTKSDNTITTGYLTSQTINSTTYKNTTNKDYGTYSGTFKWGTCLFLFSDTSNKLYKYDSGSMIDIGENYPPTEQTFLTNGKEVLPVAFSLPLKVLVYVKDKPSIFSLLTGKPFPTIIKFQMPLSDVSNIDFLTLTQTSTNSSKIRIFVSTDDITYQTFKGSYWENYSLVTSNILAYGMTATEFGNANFNTLTYSSVPKKLYIAFYLELDSVSDSLNIDNLSGQFDLEGTWDQLKQLTGSTNNFKIMFSGNEKMSIELYAEGKYKINYPY